MIQDLADLRANRWVPRREEGPKTIDAIHKEAQQQEQERQVRIFLFVRTVPFNVIDVQRFVRMLLIFLFIILGLTGVYCS